MTISSTTRIAGPFTGNGVTTTFPFTYKVFDAADVQVIRLTISTGIETTLTIVTDYTIALNGDQDSNPGGNIVLVTPLLALYTLTATSDIANLQPTDLTNQGGFYPEVITDALDRATIQIQQLADQTDRAIKIPISDGVLDMTTPGTADRLGKYLAFDSLGLPIASAGTGNDSALRTDLANASASLAGSRLSGFRQTGTGATARTVDAKLKDTVSVKDFGSNLGVALTDLGATETTLIIDDDVTVSVNTIIPTTLAIEVKKGSIITVNNTITLTVNGSFTAGIYSVFTYVGTGNVTFAKSSVDQMYPEWWGAVGDGSTSCTTAFTNLTKTVNSSGFGRLFFSGTQYNFTPVISAVTCAFLNVTSFTMTGKSIIYDTTSSYSGTDTTTFMQFTTCSKIEIGSQLSFVSVVNIGVAIKGLSWFKFLQGCTYISGGGIFNGGLHCYIFYRLITESTSYISKYANLNIDATGVYYPLMCDVSGEYINANLVTTACGRSIFLNASGNHSKINIKQKNQVGANIIGTYGTTSINALGVTDVELSVVDRDSTTNNLGIPVLFQFYNTFPATISNIKVNIDVKNVLGTPVFSDSVAIWKLDNSQNPDTVGRGHQFKNIYISGISDQAGTGYETIAMQGAFASADVVSNIVIGPLTSSGSSSDIQLVFGNALSDGVFFNNCNFGNATTLGVSHTTGRTVFNSCTMQHGSLLTSDTSVQDYIACEITNGTLQSYLYRSFFNTKINGIFLTSYGGNFTQYLNTITTGTVTPVSINGASSQFKGILTLINSGGGTGVFQLTGANNVTYEISDPSANYSIASGTATSTNVYWSGANLRYEIQNNTGSTQNYTMTLLYAQ